ncbi:MAG: Hsp20 family protein [Prevotella sp.]|nr:Hsp20 family protein [Prevotella sp.]
MVKEEITAKVENGVLTVTMPKVINKEDEKKVQRQIEVG